MSDPAPATGDANTGRQCGGRCRGRGRAAFFVIALVALTAIGTSLATRAFSHGPMWHRGGFGMTMDPTEIDSRIDRFMRHFAIEVDATKEQQTRLAEIAKKAAAEALPLRQKLMGGRDRGRDILTQAKVDRAEIEKLRTDQIAVHEQLSRILAGAVADASDVLTLEQRKKIAERMAQWKGRRWGPHRN